MMNYPLEIFSSIKKGKAGTNAFIIEARLIPCDEPTMESILKGNPNKELFPLQIVSNYSVFKLSIIANQTSCTVNLKPSKIAALSKKADYFYKKWLDTQLDVNTSPNMDPGKKNITFRFGTNKGKSPSQVLAEKGEAALRSEIEVLKSNINQYPGNKYILDTCYSALKNPINSPGAETPKTVTYPLLYEWNLGYYNPEKINGKNYYKATTLNISFDSSSKNPFIIKISVMKAPVETKEDGRTSPIPSEALDGSTRSVTSYLSADEFISAIQAMEMHLNLFNQTFYYNQYKLAWTYENKKKFSS